MRMLMARCFRLRQYGDYKPHAIFNPIIRGRKKAYTAAHQNIETVFWE